MKIIRLFNELLGTYGDRGNAEILQYRLAARNIDCEIIDISYNQKIPTDGDFYLIGGAEDKAQILASKKINENKILKSISEEGKVILAVCAGYQILGESFYAQDEKHEGARIFPIESTPGVGRMVGDLLLETEFAGKLTGFENHGGVTKYLDAKLRPFAKVIKGNGNGDKKVDGAIIRNTFGTYAHGPILARNPKFADYLISLAISSPITELKDSISDQYYQARIKALS